MKRIIEVNDNYIRMAICKVKVIFFLFFEMLVSICDHPIIHLKNYLDPELSVMLIKQEIFELTVNFRLSIIFVIVVFNNEIFLDFSSNFHIKSQLA